MGKRTSKCRRSMIAERSLAILLIPILISCSQSSNDKSEDTTQTNGVKPLYARSVTRYFSDENKKDTLRVSINGESIITGEAHLQIVNHEGKPIFSTTFPANALLNHDGLIDPKRDKKVIKDRIDDFFQETHFVRPVAAEPDLSSMPDSTKAAWRTIKKDTTAVCFSYQSSKSGKSQIAYSRSLQKVVRL